MIVVKSASNIDQIQRLGRGDYGTNEGVKWVAPAEGWHKINTDGAWVQDLRSAGLGVIVRECNGGFIAEKAMKVEVTNCALTAEVEALRAGIAFALQLGLPSVVLESDSQGKCQLFIDSLWFSSSARLHRNSDCKLHQKSDCKL